MKRLLVPLLAMVAATGCNQGFTESLLLKEVSVSGEWTEVPVPPKLECTFSSNELLFGIDTPHDADVKSFSIVVGGWPTLPSSWP